MDDSTRDELLDLTEKLYDELRLVEVYIENHDSINNSMWQSLEKLLSSVYLKLADLEETIKYS